MAALSPGFGSLRYRLIMQELVLTEAQAEAVIAVLRDAFSGPLRREDDFIRFSTAKERDRPWFRPWSGCSTCLYAADETTVFVVWRRGQVEVTTYPELLEAKAAPLGSATSALGRLFVDEGLIRLPSVAARPRKRLSALAA